MTLIAIAASIAGFYLLYNTSSRADVRQDKISTWFQRRTLLSKWIGLSMLIISFIVLIIVHGFGAGILFGFVTTMTTGSLVILLSPLIDLN